MFIFGPKQRMTTVSSFRKIIFDRAALRIWAWYATIKLRKTVLTNLHQFHTELVEVEQEETSEKIDEKTTEEKLKNERIEARRKKLKQQRTKALTIANWYSKILVRRRISNELKKLSQELEGRNSTPKKGLSSSPVQTSEPLSETDSKKILDQPPPVEAKINVLQVPLAQPEQRVPEVHLKTTQKTATTGRPVQLLQLAPQLTIEAKSISTDNQPQEYSRQAETEFVLLCKHTPRFGEVLLQMWKFRKGRLNYMRRRGTSEISLIQMENVFTEEIKNQFPKFITVDFRQLDLYFQHLYKNKT
jgi:hypothetical protein